MEFVPKTQCPSPNILPHSYIFHCLCCRPDLPPEVSLLELPLTMFALGCLWQTALTVSLEHYMEEGSKEIGFKIWSLLLGV